jgi:hypothetical protein
MFASPFYSIYMRTTGHMKPGDHVAAFGLIEELSPEQAQREKEQAGLRLGLLAGAAFVFAAWGLDALGLAQAHGWWPWLKLALGGLPAILLCGLAGWLSMKSERRLAGVLAWAVLGMLMGWVAGRLPYDGVPAALRVLDPGLASMIAYNFGSGPLTRAWLAALGAGGAFLLAGALYGSAIEASRFATAPLGRWLSFGVCAILFMTAGFAVDVMVNQPLREPIVVLDSVAQYRLDHLNTPASSAVARDMHLAVFNPVRDLLSRPRRLIVAGNDDVIQLVTVLIDFDGSLARCTVTIGQPGFCELLAG